MKTNKILALRVALLIASKAATDKSNVEDDGTCNLDTPCLVLPGWTKQEIEEAFQLTGLYPNIYNNCVHIGGVVEGCGFKRTAMAEAFRDSLKQSGYNSYVYYKID